MNLRLSDEETDLLRRAAEKEDRSMNDVARRAILEYVQRRDHREEVRRIGFEEIDRWSDLLDKLRDS